MQQSFYDFHAPKKLQISASTVTCFASQRVHHINLSRALEQRLVEMLLEEKRRQWRKKIAMPLQLTIAVSKQAAYSVRG